MTRVPEVHRESLPKDLWQAYDAVVADGQPTGPGAIAIHSPELARLRQPIGTFMRQGLKIDNRITELAILTTARALDCPYAWNAHARVAVKAGVAEDFVNALRDRQPLPSAPDDESAIVRFTFELLRTHTVSNETFALAHAVFGTQGLVELTSLVGYYAQNCFLVNVFDVDLPTPINGPALPV